MIVGGLAAWGALWGGAIILVPQLNVALTTGDEPVEMTWQELADHGISSNAHIRLVGIQLVGPNPLDEFEGLPPGQVNEVLADIAARPVVVAPLDVDPNLTPETITVPISRAALAAAYAEAEESNTLTGRFSVRGFESPTDDIAGEFAADLINVAASDEGQSNRFTYQPISAVCAPADAIQYFALGIIVSAIGLVVCGAGGPSVLCCFFFQGPSLLSLLGYPMRYGRAGRMTRIIYGLIGLSLIGYGYEQLIVEGRIHKVDANILSCVLGYLELSVGSAALLGALVNALAAKWQASTEVRGDVKTVAKQKMTYSQVCGMEREDAVTSRRYCERSVVSQNRENLDSSVKAVTSALETLEFSAAASVQWRSSRERENASLSTDSIQIGCQNMVVAEVQKCSDETQTRLISMLDDGLTLITLSPGDGDIGGRRLGSAGYYAVCESSDPQTMLANHLEQTVSMAEKRGTAVVSFDASEIIDVSQFASRVLASVQTQYGEAHYEVGNARYGRFRFPPQPIAQPVLA
ncbi:hypothetical protein [Rubripirellula tenax]|uniref:hypothetical protein n=1 Tax=Rubripirellula tenax TaxID=2528015 RepID=UPI0011B3EA17|nr:hypothetical protein [Rubripirellula tenax]